MLVVDYLYLHIISTTHTLTIALSLTTLQMTSLFTYMELLLHCKEGEQTGVGDGVDSIQFALEVVDEGAATHVHDGVEELCRATQKLALPRDLAEVAVQEPHRVGGERGKGAGERGDAAVGGVLHVGIGGVGLADLPYITSKS